MRVFAAFIAFAAAAWAQQFSDARVETVITGYTYIEGLAWSPTHFLYFSDVPTNRILRAGAGEKPVVVREDSGGAVGNAFDAKGNLYTCETRGRRVIRMEKSGKVEVLASAWEGKRLNAPNEVVVRRDGHLYFTDPAFGAQADTRELDFYGIYHLPPKGPLAVIARPRGRPNGLALSPNGKLLYVANSDERRVYAYDLDGRGDASGERVVIATTDGPPDGLCADEKGNLYVAARKLAAYTPEGKPLEAFDLPETPRGCVFGDPDLQTLYVAGQSSVFRIRLGVKGASQH